MSDLTSTEYNDRELSIQEKTEKHPDNHAEIFESRLISLKETAKRLGVSYETVRQLVKQKGELRYLQRPGCSIRIFETSLNDYIERYSCQGQNSPLAPSNEKIAPISTSGMRAKTIRLEQKIMGRR